MNKIQHKRIDSNSDFFEWYESLKNNNKMVADRLEMISYKPSCGNPIIYGGKETRLTLFY